MAKLANAINQSIFMLIKRPDVKVSVIISTVLPCIDNI